MKRLLVLLLVLALAVATAAPAVGEPPPGKGPPPENPGPHTCQTVDGDWIRSSRVGGDPFTIGPNSGRSIQWCVDVDDVPAGLWDIDLTVAGGTVRRLLVVLRDSVAPGDLCGSVEATKLTPGLYGLEFTSPYGSGVDACGTEFVEEGTTNEDPALALLVYMWAHGKDTPTVTLTVDPPGQSYATCGIRGEIFVAGDSRIRSSQSSCILLGWRSGVNDSVRPWQLLVKRGAQVSSLQ